MMESDLLFFADSVFWAGFSLGLLVMFVLAIAAYFFLDRETA